MSRKKYVWLTWILSVVLTSSLPMLIRVIIYFGQRVQDVVYPFTTIDIISTALFLLLAISYQILSSPIYKKDDKYIFMAISFVFVVFFVLLYTQTLSDKDQSRWLIPNLIVLVGVLVYSVFHVNLIASKGK